MPMANYKSSVGVRRGRKATSKHPAITHESMFSMSAFDAERDLPIVYCDRYNIHMFGLELLHQFDTKKYGRLAKLLDYQFLDTKYARHLFEDEQSKIDDLDQVMPRRLRYLRPNRPINLMELRNHHTPAYIMRAHENKSLVAQITEVWLLNLLPLCSVEARLLEPIKWQVSGTIYAANLAMQHGWSINLGGGFHQASQGAGANFCLFSDVMLAIRYIWRKHPLQKFLIIDLDAHQAVGLERDLARLPERQRDMIFMLDVFNNSIQPADSEADAATNLRIELGRFTGDATYLQRLSEALAVAHSQFNPSLVIYIAGQDVLEHDPLGLMNLSDFSLMRRDELVFEHAVERHRCPIVMLLAGGYQPRGLKVQAESIRRLFARGLIWGGHRSGSRTLTRPRQSPKPPSDTAPRQPQAAGVAAKAAAGPAASLTEPLAGNQAAAVAVPAAKAESTRKSLDTIGTHPVAPAPVVESTQGFTLMLKTALNKAINSSGLDHPVDAISESVSTSGGTHRVRKVVRVGPKAPHMSNLAALSASQKSLAKSASRRRRLELTKKTVGKALQASQAAKKAPAAAGGSNVGSKSNKTTAK